MADDAKCRDTGAHPCERIQIFIRTTTHLMFSTTVQAEMQGDEDCIRNTGGVTPNVLLERECQLRSKFVVPRIGHLSNVPAVLPFIDFES